MTTQSSTPQLPHRAPQRPPFQRTADDRWIAGVCSGLARHLGMPLVATRAIMAGLGLMGVGILLYLFWWATMDSDEEPAGQHNPSSTRGMIISALVLIAVAVIAVPVSDGRLSWAWVGPVLLGALGLFLAWGQLDGFSGIRDGDGNLSPGALFRLGAGAALVITGVVLLTSRGESLGTVMTSALAALAVLAGVAVVLAPWWLRLFRSLGEERAALAKETERANIAAHLHDSVLQSLALIRAQPENPELVGKIARAQERELREWLYTEHVPTGASLATQLRRMIADIEDERDVDVETVIVSDVQPTIATESLVQATREALLNAIRHGAAPFTLYVEMNPERVEVFIRDRGDGFDLNTIPADRLGVRESIFGRMDRAGGSAALNLSAGTEVHLQLPLKEKM